MKLNFECELIFIILYQTILHLFLFYVPPFPLCSSILQWFWTIFKYNMWYYTRDVHSVLYKQALYCNRKISLRDLPLDNVITGPKGWRGTQWSKTSSISITIMKKQGRFQLRNCYLQLHLRLGSLLPKQQHLDTQAQRAGQEHYLLLAQVPNWKAEIKKKKNSLTYPQRNWSIQLKS